MYTLESLQEKRLIESAEAWSGETIEIEHTKGITKPSFIGEFKYQGIQYKLKIKDPIFIEQFQDIKHAVRFTNVLATISLGSLFHGYAYKLLVAIISNTKLEEK